MIQRCIGRWTLPCLLAAATALCACATHQPKPSVPVSAEPATQAQAPAPTPAPKAKAASVVRVRHSAQGRKLWGIVESIDPSAKKLTLKSSTGVTHDLALADGAMITKGGNNSKIGLEDVKQGDKVIVHVDGTTALDLHVNVAAAQ